MWTVLNFGGGGGDICKNITPPMIGEYIEYDYEMTSRNI